MDKIADFLATAITLSIVASFAAIIAAGAILICAMVIKDLRR